MIAVGQQEQIEVYISDQGFLCIKGCTLEASMPVTMMIRPELIDFFMKNVVDVVAGKEEQFALPLDEDDP